MQELEEHLQRGGFDLSSLSLSTSYQTGRRGTVVIGRAKNAASLPSSTTTPSPPNDTPNTTYSTRHDPRAILNVQESFVVVRVRTRHDTTRDEGGKSLDGVEASGGLADEAVEEVEELVHGRPLVGLGVPAALDHLAEALRAVAGHLRPSALQHVQRHAHEIAPRERLPVLCCVPCAVSQDRTHRTHP